MTPLEGGVTPSHTSVVTLLQGGVTLSRTSLVTPLEAGATLSRTSAVTLLQGGVTLSRTSLVTLLHYVRRKTPPIGVHLSKTPLEIATSYVIVTLLSQAARAESFPGKPYPPVTTDVTSVLIETEILISVIRSQR